MKNLFLFLFPLILPLAASANSIDDQLLANKSAIKEVCQEHLEGMGSDFLEAARKLYSMANRTTREAYLGFDGSPCSRYLRNLPGGRSNGEDSCATVTNQVIFSLESCWDRYNRGCVKAIANQYAYELAQAGRRDRDCRAILELKCRRACYPRFPSDCNRSCAILGSYAR